MENFGTILGLDAEILIATGLAWAGKVFAAALIMVVGRWISHALVNWLRRAMDRAAVDATLTRFLTSLVNIVLLVVLTLTALGAVGIPTTNFLAILGAAGLGVGLALKDSLSNFSAGIMLVIFRPFRVGDFVETADVAGTIEFVGIFSTRIKTPDNRVITVPNGLIYANVITNYSAEATRRIDLLIGIDYKDSVQKAKEIIRRVLDSEPRVLQDPAPVLLLMDLADNSVNIAVRPWVQTADYWSTRSDLLERIKIDLEAAGLSIPFPQRSVHIVTQASSSP